MIVAMIALRFCIHAETCLFDRYMADFGFVLHALFFHRHRREVSQVHPCRYPCAEQHVPNVVG